MTKKRVLIAGGGVSGLVMNHVLTKEYKDVEVRVLEPGSVGGEFLSGGLKYIHQTDEMEEMLNQLEVLYSPYTVQGGIFLRERVEPYPGCFQGMDKEQQARIQADHYRKTRRTEPGDFGKKAMNDPAASGPRKALKCDFAHMIRALARDANIWRASLAQIEGNRALVGGEWLDFDFMALTIPLWIIREIVSWEVPQGLSARLNVALIRPERDPYAKWDYVYTPYTPGDAIHRFSPNGSGYATEINGVLNKDKLKLDLDFIFKEGWTMLGLKEGLKGHLLPLEHEPDWPDNVAPLGRFARWDPRATTDGTLTEARALAQRWLA